MTRIKEAPIISPHSPEAQDAAEKRKAPGCGSRRRDRPPAFDETAPREDVDATQTRPRVRRLRKAPLLPEAGAGGAPLTAVIAVISALAALALAAFMLVRLAADNWTAELAASLTVQVKGVDVAEIETRTALAREVLDTTPGVP